MRGGDTHSDHTDRQAILNRLADTIDLTHEQIADIETETLEEQELQIKWIRAFGYLTGQYRKLLKDEDLDELEEDIDLMKHMAGIED